MVFLDTNVILDILDEKRERHHAALMILSAAEKGAIKCCMSAKSVLDAAYVRTQTDKVSVSDFRRAATILCRIIAVRSITDDDIKFANQSDIDDYEDAAQINCAARKDCTAIVTSDKTFKNYTKIPTYTVTEFYEKLFQV